MSPPPDRSAVTLDDVAARLTRITAAAADLPGYPALVFLTAEVDRLAHDIAAALHPEGTAP